MVILPDFHLVKATKLDEKILPILRFLQVKNRDKKP
jgi:hypothetical protein